MSAAHTERASKTALEGFLHSMSQSSKLVEVMVPGHIHTDIHTYIHTCIHMSMLAHTQTHACVQACLHACKHTLIYVEGKEDNYPVLRVLLLIKQPVHKSVAARR